MEAILQCVERWWRQIKACHADRESQRADLLELTNLFLKVDGSSLNNHAPCQACKHVHVYYKARHDYTNDSEIIILCSWGACDWKFCFSLRVLTCNWRSQKAAYGKRYWVVGLREAWRMLKQPPQPTADFLSRKFWLDPGLEQKFLRRTWSDEYRSQFNFQWSIATIHFISEVLESL